MWRLFEESLTPWLTGAGARSAVGTDIGHENAEGMAYVGVRVEPPVRLGSVGTMVSLHKTGRYLCKCEVQRRVGMASHRGKSAKPISYSIVRSP